MKTNIGWLVSMLAVAVLYPSSVHATDYYVSSSLGADVFKGVSSERPWKSFEKLNKMTLQPGDRVLLKRGDTWGQMLHLSGKGTMEKRIRLGAWGTGAKPLIQRNSYTLDRCVQIENPSCWVISDLQMQHAKIGLYLRYVQSFNNTNITVARCDFRDMISNEVNPALPQNKFEVAWSTGIFLGGQTTDAGTVVRGVHIKQCTFDRIHGAGVISNFYFPRNNRTRIMDFTVEDCLATNCANGVLAIHNVTGVTVRRCVSRSGGGPLWFGSCMLFLVNAMNGVIEDCEFIDTNRNEAGDGEGIDIDGNCDNITVRRCLFKDNDAAGLMFLASDGTSRNVTIRDSVFIGNARGPAHSHDNYEVTSGSSGNMAKFLNCRFYKRDGRGYFSDGAEGLNHSDPSNRFGSLAEVWNLRTVWNNLNGWSLHNGWQVSPRTLLGTAMPAYVSIKSARTGRIKLQWQTETDSQWYPASPSEIPLKPGQNRVHLSQLQAIGVINRLRLSGDTAAVSRLALTDSMKTDQSSYADAGPLPERIIIPCIAEQTGQVWESQEGSGQGGQPTSPAMSMPFGDDTANRASRLILSFDTSRLPKDAVIRQATLMLTRTGTRGAPETPWMTPWEWLPSWGNHCQIDLNRGALGSSTSLQAEDFEARATVRDAGSMIILWRDGLAGYCQIRPHALPYINKDGLTQFRVRFKMMTNTNGIAEWVEVASGTHTDINWRPMLAIEYVRK